MLSVASLYKAIAHFAPNGLYRTLHNPTGTDRNWGLPLRKAHVCRIVFYRAELDLALLEATRPDPNIASHYRMLSFPHFTLSERTTQHVTPLHLIPYLTLAFHYKMLAFPYRILSYSTLQDCPLSYRISACFHAPLFQSRIIFLLHHALPKSTVLLACFPRIFLFQTTSNHTPPGHT